MRGSASCRRCKQRQGDFSEFLTPNGGRTSNQPAGAGTDRHPRRLPGCRHAGARTATSSPYITPLGRVLANCIPAPNYVDPNNRYNYVLSQLEPHEPPRHEDARSTTTSSNNTKAYVRVARESEEVESARGVWWGASDVALPIAERRHEQRPLGSPATSSRVLSPTMTNEALVSAGAG